MRIYYEIKVYSLSYSRFQTEIRNPPHLDGYACMTILMTKIQYLVVLEMCASSNNV